MEENKKTVKVSQQTWELLNFIKSRKKLKSLGDVVDLLLNKKKLNPSDFQEIINLIDQLG